MGKIVGITYKKPEPEKVTPEIPADTGQEVEKATGKGKKKPEPEKGD